MIGHISNQSTTSDFNFKLNYVVQGSIHELPCLVSSDQSTDKKLTKHKAIGQMFGVFYMYWGLS